MGEKLVDETDVVKKVYDYVMLHRVFFVNGRLSHDVIRAEGFTNYLCIENCLSSEDVYCVGQDMKCAFNTGMKDGYCVKYCYHRFVQYLF